MERHFYQAFAVVHWNMNVVPPVTGWLDERFHHDFRELVLHACARERLFCAAYCLMPDHLHLVWMGLSLQSDQLNGMKFLRTQLNRLLAGSLLENRAVDSRPRPRTRPPWELQPQAHDRVLREEERRQHTFANVCFYILANPVRAGLVKREQEWPFSGAVVPGCPDMYPFQDGFWELFWKLYYKQREPTPTEPLKPP